jgi:hypothetical protein
MKYEVVVAFFKPCSHTLSGLTHCFGTPDKWRIDSVTSGTVTVNSKVI